MLTDDPKDPRLTHGADSQPAPQAKVYLVLSEAERAKGFVRPLRLAYRHVGQQPTHPLRDLTPEEHERYDRFGYVKFEDYIDKDPQSSVVGRFWTQADLDKKACGTVTKMALPLCETYARDPNFYGATYCCGCQRHLPVQEFVWIEQDGSEGPVVGT
jgi:hypothetical protein